MDKPRVRFAPSPTGYLHIGGARTALFNWLWARRSGGTFILRIEDTDRARSTKEAEAAIFDGLRWLGLDWDEGPEVGGPHGPYFQSERLDRYREMAEQLVRNGHAYYCYCAAQEQQGGGKLRPYDADSQEGSGGLRSDEAVSKDAPIQGFTQCACATLPSEEVARREASAMPRAIRFRVPPGRTGFDDLVHGRVAFDNEVIEDF